MKVRYHKMVEQFVGQLVTIVEMLINKQGMMMVTELCGIVNERLGFVVDWRVCEVGEFCQFLMYYCQNVSDLQFISGNFFVCAKGTLMQHNYHTLSQHQSHQSCSHLNHCHYMAQQYYCHYTQ